VNLYPRSFLALIVLGGAIVMLPLLATVGYASFAVDELTRRSDEVVDDASQVSMSGYALDEELNQMELILRQYEALRDPMLLSDYAAVRKDWRRTVQKFAAIPTAGPLRADAYALSAAEAAAFRQLGAHGEGLQSLRDTLAAIDSQLPRLLERANRRMHMERHEFRAQAGALSERMLAALVAAVALSGGLLFLGRKMLGRLLGQVDRAILTLGEGRLQKPIQLDGPPDLKRLGLRLDWLRRRLLALETERTRLLRHVSHELKTPLAAIREGASLLHDGVGGTLTPTQEKVAGIMQANVTRLQKLIDSFLSIQQANHMREHMETSAIRFDEVVKQTLETYALAMRGRQLRFTGSLAPLIVEGSADGLATLTGNLVSNAVKFSPAGGTVQINLMRRDERAVLDVIDDGPGVKPEHRDRVFEPFYRAPEVNHIDGVGLGLAIAHEFAVAHRGTLECVESERGAHFRLQLPVAQGGAP
jgi:two-component system, NtrC family, sensor histidine kinase GlrK